jgi:hypothetical protein
MNTKIACVVFLVASSLGGGTAAASYLAPDPGTQVSIQLNSHDVLVVRPVGGVWTLGLCPNVTAGVLTTSHWARPSHGFGDKGYNYATVWDLLVQAALHGRSVNLQVSDTVCHANGYPLIETVTIFP